MCFSPGSTHTRGVGVSSGDVVGGTPPAGFLWEKHRRRGGVGGTPPTGIVGRGWGCCVTCVHHWKAHDVKCHQAAARISSQTASWAAPPLHSSQLPAYARQYETVSSRFFAHRLAFGRPRPEGMKTTKCPNSVKSLLHTASACLEATEAPEPLCPVLLPHSVPASHTKACPR